MTILYARTGGDELRIEIQVDQDCKEPKVLIITDQMTEEVKEQFEEFRKIYLSNKYKNYHQAYGELCYKYYSRVDGGSLVLLPKSERPTYNQFYWYCYTNTTKEALDLKRMGADEQRNNKRLLLNSVRAKVKRPAQMLELDALEADVELV